MKEKDFITLFFFFFVPFFFFFFLNFLSFLLFNGRNATSKRASTRSYRLVNNTIPIAIKDVEELAKRLRAGGLPRHGGG